MLYIISGVLTRIFSNSYLNVFQKILTEKGNKPSVINFYTYLGLSIISICIFPYFKICLSVKLLINFLAMGILGTLGNYFIIKSLSIGELSSLAPINSYKPIVAMVFAFLYLKEIPTIQSILGILLIIIGTYLLHRNNKLDKKAVFYRVLALVFSGTEAVFIKKIILLTNIPTSFFLWSISGLIFAFLLTFNNIQKEKISSYKYLIFLIISVSIMQYSTNYVFSKINVSYALALFQLSTILSVFLGANIFKEKNFIPKIIAAIVMLLGSIAIILS